MKILLVEDDAMIGQNILNALKFQGYEVCGPLQNGEEAIHEFKRFKPDLAILDVELKDHISGLQVAEAIRRVNAIPLIFVTGLMSDDILQRAKQLGAFAFINKPFHERNLFNAIDMALDGFSKNEFKQDDQSGTSTTAVKIKDRFYIKKNNKYIRVELSDVLFMEASGHYIVVQLKNEQVLASSNLSAFLEQLNHPDLLRVHRSFAVNVQNIPDFDDTFMYFSQKAVPISRAYKDEVKRLLNTI